MPIRICLWLLLACSSVLGQQVDLPPEADEPDARLQADGQGWRLDKAKVIDDARPRVLLIGDSILNGYRSQVAKALQGTAYVDAWVNPYNQQPHLNKLLAQVLEHGPYDVVHFNMGLHGWQEGRIKPGTFEPLTKAYIEVIKHKLPNARIIWASTTPVTVKNQPNKLDPVINPIIIDHNRRAATVMAEMKVPTNDFYELLVDQLELARGDQFHWKREAYDAMAKVIVASIRRELNLPQAYSDPTPQHYRLSKRASEIDPRAKEHPELGFVFTDAKGKATDIQHATVDTRVAPRGKLVIWLMRHNSGLFDRLASYGLHGIQVHYANGWFSKIDPKVRDSGEALGDIRLEAATGEDHSPHVSIPQPDGMKERSLQFVKWLAKENPQGNWQQYLTEDGNDLRWDQVIVSGISHGSTTAARFAKHQAVSRVVMFSGPRDQYESWQSLPSATDSNRFFGFTHVLDSGWVGDHYCRSWEMLGLHQYGRLVDVDKTESPYEYSRRLITNADVDNNARRAHSGSVPGGSAVKNADGTYLHEPVWRYLFTQPVEITGEAVAPDPACRKDLRKQ